MRGIAYITAMFFVGLAIGADKSTVTIISLFVVALILSQCAR